MYEPSIQGFTLIEVLIVIAITGALASVLIPNLIAARTRAYDVHAMGCARSIYAGEELYKLDNASYTGVLSSMDGVRPCSHTQLTVNNVTADANHYEWSVAHTLGRGPIGVTQHGVQR